MFSEIALWILITMSWQLFGGGSEGFPFSIFLYSVKDTEYLLLWSCIRLMVMTGNVQSISFTDRTYSYFKKVSSSDISHLTLLRNMSGWLRTGQWPLERENEVAATLSLLSDNLYRWSLNYCGQKRYFNKSRCLGHIISVQFTRK